MGFKVIAPLVAIAPSEKSGDLDDANEGPRYFYQGAVIQDGFNDKRCKELVDEGMLEKVKADKADDASQSTEPSVKDILAEVGEDKAKAQAALDAERDARGDKARKTLVEPLEKVLAG
jgi:hypothetical protein